MGCAGSVDAVERVEAKYEVIELPEVEALLSPLQEQALVDLT